MGVKHSISAFITRNPNCQLVAQVFYTGGDVLLRVPLSAAGRHRLLHQQSGVPWGEEPST